MFERTTTGARLRAAVDNQSMAQATGMNVPVLFSATFALGCGLAALGGILAAPMLPMEPMWPFKYLVLVLVVVALAGHGQVTASVAVAVIVGIVETAGRYLFPQHGGFVIYLLLIALMVCAPRRAAGAPRREGLSRESTARRFHPESPSLSASASARGLPPRWRASSSSRSTSRSAPRCWSWCCWCCRTTCCLASPACCRSGMRSSSGWGLSSRAGSSLAGWTDPISRALLGAAAAGVAAALVGPFLLRLTGLPLLMVTLALGVLVFEAAHKATRITGGDDGLSGIQFAPIFGVFDWSLGGRTSYLYVLGWLVLLFVLP